jgi:aspartate racemase
MSIAGEGRARRRVGILGGMGPMATQAFYRDLIASTPATLDQDHLEVVIVADPTIPDRTAFLLGEGPDPTPALRKAARALERAGAELIVMPCNTAQAFVPTLERDSGVPFIDWVGAAVEATVGLDQAPVGVMSTAGTAKVGTYARGFQAHGFPFLEPDRQELDAIMRCIYRFKATNKSTSQLQGLLVGVARSMAARGARSLLLACTELPLVLPASSSRWPIPAIDPSHEAATRTVQAAW